MEDWMGFGDNLFRLPVSQSSTLSCSKG